MGWSNLLDKRMHGVLPPDLIFEIVIRADIESLPRFRWVCKEWRRLISHPSFINSHPRKSKIVRGFILDNTSVDKYDACRTYDIHFFPHPSAPLSESLPSLTFMLEPVNIKASTPHGLLLCFGLFNKRYYVCKPTTQEWATIPKHRTLNLTVRIVLSVASSSPLRFRIMKILRHRTKLQYSCEVFDSNSCGIWKTIEGVGPLFDDNQFTTSSVCAGLVFNGSLFWIEHIGFLEVTKIICFDLWKEEGKTLELPKEATGDGNGKAYNMLSNQNGSLGLVRRYSMNLVFDIWTMNNLVEQKWEKIQVVDLKHGNPLAAMVFSWIRFDFVVDNTVLLSNNANRHEIFWYNFREDKYMKTDVRFALNANDLYFFQSDYFPCNIDECPYNIPSKSDG